MEKNLTYPQPAAAHRIWSREDEELVQSDPRKVTLHLGGGRIIVNLAPRESINPGQKGRILGFVQIDADTLKAWRRDKEYVAIKIATTFPSSPLKEEDFAPTARTRAVLRGIQMAREDLRLAGGGLKVEDVSTLLDISRQAIDKKVKQGQILWVPGPGNARRYPACQFTASGRIVEGLDEILAAYPDRNPWSRLNFLVRPHVDLDDMAPIDALKAGDLERLVDVARHHGEQVPA